MKKVLITWMVFLIAGKVAAESSLQLIALNCGNCHSTSGLTLINLKTLSAQDINQALLDFKYDRRQSTLMGRLAKGFSDEEIKAVAELVGKPGKE